MKIRLYFAALALATLSFSCSNNDEASNENKKLENTSWTSTTPFHYADNVAVDKSEENSIILTKINEMHGFEYVEDTKTKTQDWFWNLCEKEGHDNDSIMSVSFSSDKCYFKS